MIDGDSGLTVWETDVRARISYAYLNLITHFIWLVLPKNAHKVVFSPLGRSSRSKPSCWVSRFSIFSSMIRHANRFFFWVYNLRNQANVYSYMGWLIAMFGIMLYYRSNCVQTKDLHLFFSSILPNSEVFFLFPYVFPRNILTRFAFISVFVPFSVFINIRFTISCATRSFFGESSVIKFTLTSEWMNSNTFHFCQISSVFRGISRPLRKHSRTTQKNTLHDDIGNKPP